MSDEDELTPDSELPGAPVPSPRRVSARAAKATHDTSSEAMAEAKARALEAVETMVAVMRSPGRNAQSQTFAAVRILELAGIGGAGEAALERFIKALRVLPPSEAQKVLRALNNAERILQ